MALLVVTCWGPVNGWEPFAVRTESVYGIGYWPDTKGGEIVSAVLVRELDQPLLVPGSVREVGSAIAEAEGGTLADATGREEADDPEPAAVDPSWVAARSDLLDGAERETDAVRERVRPVVSDPD